MEKEDSSKSIRENLKSFSSNQEKIDFLREYIKSRRNINLDSLAYIYESLAELNKKQGEEKASFHKKAASTWEISSTIKEATPGRYRRIALKNALRNYKKAYSIYKKKKLKTEKEEIKSNIIEVKKELRNYGGYLKIITLTAIIIIFIASSFLIASFPTGFVTSPLRAEETTVTGIGLGIASLIAMLFVIWKWK